MFVIASWILQLSHLVFILQPAAEVSEACLKAILELADNYTFSKRLEHPLKVYTASHSTKSVTDQVAIHLERRPRWIRLQDTLDQRPTANRQGGPQAISAPVRTLCCHCWSQSDTTHQPVSPQLRGIVVVSGQ